METELAVIPAQAGIQKLAIMATMDYSLRSPYGPPLRAFSAQALLSGLRRDDEIDRLNWNYA